MNTKKILEFNPEGLSLFCRHLEFLAKQQGWDFQFEAHPEFSPELLTGATMAKVDIALSQEVLKSSHIQPTLVRMVQCLDSFIYEGGKWYPRLLIFKALHNVLVDCARDLDIRHPGFVVGDAEMARVAASVLAQIGFSEIYLVGKDDLLLSQQAELLKRNHLGIEFRPLMSDQLTVQSTSAAVVINTVDITRDADLLSDLSYFNFMKREGYALDLTLLPVENPLLEEAERAELRILPPIWVAAEHTRLWLDALASSEPSVESATNSLKVEDLRLSWQNFFKEISSSV